MNQIDVATLQTWLEQKRDVVVLDIRKEEDREQWSIPGSSHVNAYDELKAGRPGPLAELRLPSGIPVVTVCPGQDGCGRGREVGEPGERSLFPARWYASLEP